MNCPLCRATVIIEDAEIVHPDSLIMVQAGTKVIEGRRYVASCYACTVCEWIEEVDVVDNPIPVTIGEGLRHERAS